ncbi:MAG: hypothetical protein AAGF56_08475 [Pseudomonadota bacterium]
MKSMTLACAMALIAGPALANGTGQDIVGQQCSGCHAVGDSAALLAQFDESMPNPFGDQHVLDVAFATEGPGDLLAYLEKVKGGSAGFAIN